LTLDGYPHRGQPIMLTEFGGIAYIKGRRSAGAKAWGYSKASTERQFLKLFTDLMSAVISSPLFSGFCYTQFTDTFQEMNGLLTADRTPKIPLKAIAKAVSQTRTHIQGGV
jgi:hypothetical protein